jgi:hypothetical protein
MGRSKSKQKRQKIDFKRRRHARAKRVRDRLKSNAGSPAENKSAEQKEKPRRTAKAHKAS